MPTLANPKHEAFAQALANGKPQDQAYAAAGYKPSVHHASRLARHGKVVERLAELHAAAAKTFEITVEATAAQLDETYRLAKKWKQPSAMVAAAMGKAKLGGLLVERSTVQVTHNYQLMSEDEIRFELAALAAEARNIKPGVQH